MYRYQCRIYLYRQLCDFNFFFVYSFSLFVLYYTFPYISIYTRVIIQFTEHLYHSDGAGAPNDDYLLNTLKTHFSVSRVLLDL